MQCLEVININVNVWVFFPFFFSVESHGNVDENRPNSEILEGFWKSQWKDELVSKPGEQG